MIPFSASSDLPLLANLGVISVVLDFAAITCFNSRGIVSIVLDFAAVTFFNRRDIVSIVLDFAAVTFFNRRDVVSIVLDFAAVSSTYVKLEFHSSPHYFHYPDKSISTYTSPNTVLVASPRRIREVLEKCMVT
jgi:hypothetical protein